MSDKDVELKIGADGKQAEAEFDKVGDAAEKAGKRISQTMREASYKMAESTKEATAQMSEHFSKVTESFEKVNKMFIAFTAILAGGEVFKEGIEETNKMTMEANKLSRQMGISATDAGALNVALEDLNAGLGYNGVQSETVLAANSKLTRTLNTNEKAFKDLGVQTRDANGNLRSSLDIMLDVNTHLMSFKEGIDRNIEGQKIYGKQWSEVQGILALTTEKMEEARKKSEELGLVVGKENVEATANYNAAMNDVEDVLKGMMKSIGDALMPILTDLANWFSEYGPQAVIVMKGAIGGLAAVFYGLKMAVEIVWEVIKVFVQTSVMNLLRFADAANKAMHLDFSGAKAAWKNGADAIADNFGEALDRIAKKAEANRDKIVALFANPTATTEKEGGDHSSGGVAKKGKADKSQMGAWKAELEARKETEGNFFKNSLADDEAFWSAKLQHVKKGSADERAIEHELFGIHKTLAVQKFNDEIDGMKAQEAAARSGSEERIALATQTAARIGETYGYDSSQYLAAMKDIRKAAEEFDKEQQKLAVMKVERTRDHTLNQIGMERDHLALLKSLGQISDQEEISALKMLEEKKYQIEVQAQNDKIALMKDEGTARQQQLDELAKMKEKHDAEISKLDTQSVLAVKKNWDAMTGAVSGAFEQSLNGMIMGMQTWQKSLANIGQAVAAEFIKMGVKKATAWIGNEATMTTATVIGVGARGTAEQVGATQSMAVGAMAAVKGILNTAWETMSNVYKSIAAIPYVGPFLAPAMAAGAFGVVAGFAGRIASSEGGEWQVPTDRLNMVHKNETILPAHIASPLRDMVAGGGSMGGGHTFNISAVDAAGVKKFFERHGASLVDSLRNQGRGFNFPK